VRSSSSVKRSETQPRSATSIYYDFFFRFEERIRYMFMFIYIAREKEFRYDYDDERTLLPAVLSILEDA
jgi:hypothetical protein